MLRCFLPAASLATALAFSAATAQTGPTVTITSPGGSAVTGELVEIDGTFYKLKTSLGVIEIDMTDATCVGEGCPKADTFETFAIAGSPAVGTELVSALVLGYADSVEADIAYETGAGEAEQVLRLLDGGGEDLAAIVLVGDTESPFAALAANSAAIGVASHQITPEEVANLQASGLSDPRGGDSEHQLALDAVAILVHPENPVTSISVADLGAVFAGEITSWAAVGGPDRPIKLYAQDHRSGAVEIFEQLVLDPGGLALAESVERPENSRELADLVSVDPDAIALAGLAYVTGSKTLPIRQECGLVSEPSLFAVKAGEYPLTRRLFLYENPAQIAKHARSLLDFATSDAAQPVIAAARLVDRSLDYRALAQMGAQLAYTLASGIEAPRELFRELATELGDARRLSVTLRFAPGSIELDTSSRRSLDALARQVGEGAFDGQEILLVGFSDANGAFDENLALSQSRAEAVFAALTQAVGLDAARTAGLQVKGYGGLLPVACNTDTQGRELNRRVEVWLRPKR